MTIVRTGVRRLLRSPAVGRAVRALARARGRGLVLVYHRLESPVPPDCEIVPSVPADLFRAHVRALGEVVDLVSLDDLLSPAEAWPASRARSGRPAVALTFDDDLPSHVAHALPVLRALHAPAAFFLSGRALHGRGPYWFQQLELLLEAVGAREIAARIGVRSASRGALAWLCERDPDVRRAIAELAGSAPTPRILQREEIAQLAAAGMPIGFHTLDHATLPELNDRELREAVEDGCAELADAASVRPRFFAYPHGKSDARSAGAVRRAGFDAAFTGRPESLRPGQNRYTIGRWEPGPIPVDDLLVGLAVYLHRPIPGLSGRRGAPA